MSSRACPIGWRAVRNGAFRGTRSNCSYTTIRQNGLFMGVTLCLHEPARLLTPGRSDQDPGSNTAAQHTPTNKPAGSDEDGQVRHVGDGSSFQFPPPLVHEDALLLNKRAEKFGYKMLFQRSCTPPFTVDQDPSGTVSVTHDPQVKRPYKVPLTERSQMPFRTNS